jgi:hypothetical protein
LFHEFIAVDEYGLALKEIAGVLAQHKIAITYQERGRHAGPGRPDEDGRPRAPCGFCPQDAA